MYGIGLSWVAGRPAFADAKATKEDAAAVWRQAGGAGMPIVSPVTPHGFLYASLFADQRRPDLLIAWRIATHHNTGRTPQTGMLRWHLSGAALTVWLSRHWSTEELLDKAVQVRSGDRGLSVAPAGTP